MTHDYELRRMESKVIQWGGICRGCNRPRVFVKSASHKVTAGTLFWKCSTGNKDVTPYMSEKLKKKMIRGGKSVCATSATMHIRLVLYAHRL